MIQVETETGVEEDSKPGLILNKVKYARRCRMKNTIRDGGSTALKTDLTLFLTFTPLDCLLFKLLYTALTVACIR